MGSQFALDAETAVSGIAGDLHPQAVAEDVGQDVHRLLVLVAFDAKAEGELRIRLTGGFYDPLELDTSDSQESLIKQLAGRVLSDVSVSSHSIAALSDDVFKATAQIASKDALHSAGSHHVLRFVDCPVSSL